MTTKEEAASRLRGFRYDAEAVEGVVIVWVREKMTRAEKCEVRRRLQEIGYKGSWGWRRRLKEAG